MDMQFKKTLWTKVEDEEIARKIGGEIAIDLGLKASRDEMGTWKTPYGHFTSIGLARLVAGIFINNS